METDYHYPAGDVRRRGYRSVAWNHFYEDDEDLLSQTATCRLCMKKVKCASGTTNLFAHLNSRHIKIKDPSSAIWKLFSMVDDDVAACDICNEEMMYLPGEQSTAAAYSVATHLHKHHIEDYEKVIQENLEFDNEQLQSDQSVDYFDYFDKTPEDNDIKCKICSTKLKFPGRIDKNGRHVKLSDHLSKHHLHVDNPKSTIWNFVEFSEDLSLATCSLCLKSVANAKIIFHFESCHKDTYNEVINEMIKLEAEGLISPINKSKGGRPKGAKNGVKRKNKSALRDDDDESNCNDDSNGPVELSSRSMRSSKRRKIQMNYVSEYEVDLDKFDEEFQIHSPSSSPHNADLSSRHIGSSKKKKKAIENGDTNRQKRY